MMLQIIEMLLKQIINDIDTGNSNISENQQEEIIELLQKFTNEFLSKTESYNYIGVSRATFDNYVKQKLIPEGIKKQGITTKFWRKSDLDNFLKKR